MNTILSTLLWCGLFGWHVAAANQLQSAGDGQSLTPADYVNVFTGKGGARWMFGPGPWMPNSMVKMAPDNKVQGYRSGFDDSLGLINCFSHIHEWTMAGLGMMPAIGPLRTHAGADGTGYGSHFDKTTEQAGIGFYEVLLKDNGIKVELTATTRASLQRYTFPASDQARVLYPFMIPNEYDMHILSVTVRRVGNNEIEGTIQTDLPKLGYVGDRDLTCTSFRNSISRLIHWVDGKISEARTSPLSRKAIVRSQNRMAGRVGK